MANVIFKIGTRNEYNALQTKNENTLYWLYDVPALYKGETLYGTGSMASETMAGLLSSEDYASFKKLVTDINLSGAIAGQIPTMGESGQLTWGKIVLSRDNDYNYKKIETTFIPAKGEVCFVDVAGVGLRTKVGDGVTVFANLPYLDDVTMHMINSMIVKGYYYQDQFYSDPERAILLDPMVGRIYIEATSGKLYIFDGVRYGTFQASVPTATSDTAGIMKLYSQTGDNTDGTMTQKAITDELNDKIEMGVIEDEEMIVFNNNID